MNRSEVIDLYKMDISKLIKLNIQYIGMLEHLNFRSDTLYIVMLINE